MSIISALGEITLEVGVKKGRQEREAEILAMIHDMEVGYISIINNPNFSEEYAARLDTLRELKAKIQEASNG